ncbi:MAG TPA: hypothetical protein DHW42_00120 [Candidatus Marinimicrobia bacterium]|nr:hypothetical protein [Candidatus Neomarinimicrobiota bacterium]
MDQEFETGEIVEIIGIIAGVELQENDQCHSCGAKMICRPGASGKRMLYLKNTLNARVGDRILIEQSDKNQLKLAFMQYGLPMFGFIAAVIIANLFISETVLGIPAEIWQFVIGLSVLGIIGVFIRLWCARKAAADFSVFSMKKICQ